MVYSHIFIYSLTFECLFSIFLKLLKNIYTENQP